MIRQGVAVVFAFLLVATTALAAPVLDAPLTVGAVVADHSALNGKTIMVRGWLDRCVDLSCALFPTRAAAMAKSWERPLLSVGASPLIDNHLDQLRHAEIILEARFDNRCLENKHICLDRAPTLDPVRVVRILTPAR